MTIQYYARITIGSCDELSHYFDRRLSFVGSDYLDSYNARLLANALR